MEDVVKLFGGAYRGRRVLVTGHTGFKGAWLAEWLLAAGAEVTGLALPPPTVPSLFGQLGLRERVTHVECDIRDLAATERVVREADAEFVFHLAAQPLVRLSYTRPAETYEVNVMGTVNVLEAVRRAARACTVIAVTSDKCYENREWVHSYREEDALGGHDPYSSSKGAAEVVIGGYRRSFFSGKDSIIHLGSARAGNVIGGGDWAEDRIVPDSVRALRSKIAIPVRSKVSTRPWQHVLEPLSGYLWLAAWLAGGAWREGGPTVPVFNFGPALESNRSVLALVEEVLKHWPGAWEDRSDPRAVHEARLLNLATDKAWHLLGWRPVWDFQTSVARTMEWYREVGEDETTAPRITRAQIGAYAGAAREMNLAWTR